MQRYQEYMQGNGSPAKKSAKTQEKGDSLRQNRGGHNDKKSNHNDIYGIKEDFDQGYRKAKSIYKHDSGGGSGLFSRGNWSFDNGLLFIGKLFLPYSIVHNGYNIWNHTNGFFLGITAMMGVLCAEALLWNNYRGWRLKQIDPGQLGVIKFTSTIAFVAICLGLVSGGGENSSFAEFYYTYIMRIIGPVAYMSTWLIMGSSLDRKLDYAKDEARKKKRHTHTMIKIRESSREVGKADAKSKLAYEESMRYIDRVSASLSGVLASRKRVLSAWKDRADIQDAIYEDINLVPSSDDSPRECACGCGEIVVGDREYVDRNHRQKAYRDRKKLNK